MCNDQLPFILKSDIMEKTLSSRRLKTSKFALDNLTQIASACHSFQPVHYTRYTIRERIHEEHENVSLRIMAITTLDVQVYGPFGELYIAPFTGKNEKTWLIK